MFGLPFGKTTTAAPGKTAPATSMFGSLGSSLTGQAAPGKTAPATSMFGSLGSSLTGQAPSGKTAPATSMFGSLTASLTGKATEAAAAAQKKATEAAAAAAATAQKRAADAAAAAQTAALTKAAGLDSKQAAAAAAIQSKTGMSITSVSSFFTNFIAKTKEYFALTMLYLNIFNLPRPLFPYTVPLTILLWSVILATIGFTIYKTTGVNLLAKLFDKKTYGFSDTLPEASSKNGTTAPAGTATSAANTSNALSAVIENTKKISGFTDGSSQEITLQNAQPLTIKQIGFLGPVNDGHFDTDVGAVHALRAGFRSFIFQIDYLDTQRDEKLFGPAGIPTLLYRGDDGSLISENSADINVVVESLANSAFRPEVPNYTEPLVIYLHILRTPSATRDPDGYKSFLSKIATALNPLAPKHLGMTPLGTFNRQKQEAVLLNSPLSSFEGQVIILCNADTSIFRNTTPNIAPADDLDFWVNIRVYLNDSTEKLGITQMPPSGVTPYAVVVKLDTLLNLSSDKMDAFAAEGKKKFVIALPSQLKNPEVKDLDTALNILGVNMIPLDIFSFETDSVKALVKRYNNEIFHHKSSGLRNIIS